MDRPSHKIEYVDEQGKKHRVFFVRRNFDPAVKQIKRFIDNNKDKPNVNKIVVYYKNWISEYNYGWVYLGEV